MATQQVLILLFGVRVPAPEPAGAPSNQVAGRVAAPLALRPRSTAPSSRGLGHHPLKVEARVRIPLGLPAKVQVRALHGVPLTDQDRPLHPGYTLRLA